MITAGSKGAAYCARWVIIVDEDVNITDLDEVIWAVVTRARAPDDYELIRDGYSSGVDPIHSPEVRRRADARALTNNRSIINACRPFSWKDEFPIVNKASAELRRKVAEKFRDVLEDGGRLH